MSNGVSVKVCGITSLADAQTAIGMGATYVGFILYPKSPRYISLGDAQAIAKALPATVKKVAVLVYETMSDLDPLKDAGFDFVQLHFPNDTPFFEAALWTETIPPTQLWLAPRAAPGKELDPAFFPLADHVLVDTYHEGGFGGSGKTGNWEEFARLKGRFTKVTWILAGGLNAENISSAIAQTGAKIVDVNSGVESAPGKKDEEKLKAFFAAVAAVPAS